MDKEFGDFEFDTNFDDLGDLDLSVLDAPVVELDSKEDVVEWERKYYIGYLGLNYLTLYKEDTKTLSLLALLNPDKPKLSFFLETIKKHNDYISSKIMNENIGIEQMEAVEAIQREVRDKVSLLTSLKGFLFPEIYYINRNGEGNLLSILNNSEITRDIVSYFESTNYKKEDEQRKLSELITSISIITDMVSPNYFKEEDMMRYLQYRKRRYTYTENEYKVLEFMETPTVLVGHEDIIKPNINESVEQLQKNVRRFYFKGVVVELLNLHHSNIVKKEKTGLKALIGSLK